MKLTVIGQTGQVARELARRVPDGVTLVALGRHDADLTDPGAAAQAVAAGHPDAVINAAAYTAVDRAESEPDLAATLNADAPAAIAKLLAHNGIPFVHISTDYVFDGKGTTPFAPDDSTSPLGVYGRTKRDGEDAIRAAGGPHAILRTSWVFGAHGQNFVKTMLRLGAERDRLTIVADQVGGPTPAAAIADACHTLARQIVEGARPGTLHFSGAPDVSWADFAREIFAQARIECTVEDIPTTDYPTPAKRPLNSRLDCTGLSDYGIARPDWKRGLRDVLKELL